MSKIKLVALLFIGFVMGNLLVSCRTSNVPITTETTKIITIKEVVRDTVFTIEKDNSYYNALLECQNGKVVIKDEPKKTKGNNLEPPKVTIRDNVLEVDCEKEAQKLFAQWKDTYTIENATTVITIPVYIEKELSYWQSTEIWCGRIFIGILLMMVGYSAIRMFKK